MQIETSRISQVFSEYPILAGLLVVTFALLVFAEPAYPFSTLLLLLLTGLGFVLGAQIYRMGGQLSPVPLEQEIPSAGAHSLRTAAVEVREAVAAEASGLTESVTEAVTKPRPRRPRARAASAK